MGIAMHALLQRFSKLEKLGKSFGGMREMKKLPDAIFVIDTIEEKVAVDEAKRFNIPIIAIVDTNSDPLKSVL